MIKKERKIALFLVVIMVLNILSISSYAEEDLATQVKQLMRQTKEATSNEPEDLIVEPKISSEEILHQGQNALESDQNYYDDSLNYDELTVDQITSRSSFNPDIMVAAKGTKVFSDSHLTSVLGEILANSVIYAVSLSGNAVRIAFPTGSTILEGYVTVDSLMQMSDNGKKAYNSSSAKGGKKVYTHKLLSISFLKASETITVTPTTTVTVQPKRTPLLTVTPTPTAKIATTPTAKVTVLPTQASSAYPTVLQQPEIHISSDKKYVVCNVKADHVDSYQWQLSVNHGGQWEDLANGTTWIGSTKESMCFKTLSQYDGYMFRCKLTNQAGSVYTNLTTLNLGGKTVSLPIINSQPGDVSVYEGNTVVFQIYASNANEYQWQYSSDGVHWINMSSRNWSGSTSEKASFIATIDYTGYSFRCAVTNNIGTVYSNAVRLTVKYKATATVKPTLTPFIAPTVKPTTKPTVIPSNPIITAPVFDLSVDTVIVASVGSNIVISSNVSGATEYQWQINPNKGMWANLQEGATYQNTKTSSMTVKLTEKGLTYTYRLKATNAYGTSYSPIFKIKELLSQPTNVKAVAVSRNEIKVSWEASSDSRIREYQVFYNTTNSIDFNRFVTVTGSSAQLTGLTAGTIYHVWVKAIGTSLSSVVDKNVHASVSTLAPPVKPAAPTSIAAVPSSSTMSVSWKKPANSEVDGYVIYYRVYSSNTSQKVTVNGGDTVSAVLTGLSKNTSYQVWVTAFNEAGESNSSSSIVTKTLTAAPAPVQPTNIQASSANSTSVKVSWTLSSSDNVSGYYVYYGTSTSASNATKLNNSYSANTTSATVTGLKVGTTYYFWVSASNADGIESLLDANVRASAAPKAVSTANKINAVTFSKMGDKYIGTSYSRYDCQAFVERMLEDAGLHGWDLAGSNAWYRTMSWRGTPEQCIAKFGCIPTGAFLFILKHDGGEPAHYRDNLGNASHIGVVTHRNGGAIHSSFSRGGVYTSVFNDATIPNGGWNMVGLWTRMDYGDTVNSILESLTGR